MTDFNDPRLVFEHSLREHVNNARAMLNQFDEDMDEPHATWEIVFDSEGNGKWTVRCWRYDTKAEAAQLFDACTIAMSTARRQRAAKALPALIAAPAQETQDDTTSSGSDPVDSTSPSGVAGAADDLT